MAMSSETISTTNFSTPFAILVPESDRNFDCKQKIVENAGVDAARNGCLEENTQSTGEFGPRELSAEELSKLAKHDTRTVTPYKRSCLEKDSAKNWDRFYQRNQDKFFKNRHWITREFEELRPEVDAISSENQPENKAKRKVLLEIGCGCGNLVLPLLEENPDVFIYACDFSPSAVNLLKNDEAFDGNRCSAFVCDVISQDLSSILPESVDFATLIFVLSAINPSKMSQVLQNIRKVIRPGGKLLFRDYGLHDHAMIRFAPGHKLADKFYFRQDGTYTYYFSTDELSTLFQDAGFLVEKCDYCFRETVNKKEDIQVPRIFVQGIFVAPISGS